MPIDSDPDPPDRARETPAAPDRQGSPDVPVRSRAANSRETRDGTDATQATEFRQRQVAEHVRYQQVVDAAYQAAARRTWAEAVPDLRAAWEEHKEKYSERIRPTPQAQPDGSWTADGDRGLTPEENAEATKARADLRDEADQVILPAMRRVEAASPDGRLAGLDHMLKGEDRLKEKIAEELLAKLRQL